MKIALIQPRTSYFVAGSERVSIKHAEHLSQLGHDVELYTSLPVEKEETFFFKDLCSKKLKNLSILKFDISKRLPGLYTTEPDKEHIRWVAESLAFNQQIYNELNHRCPDVILSYYLPDSLFKPAGIPNVVYLLGNPSTPVPFYKAFIQFCNATISISSIVAEKWKEELLNVALTYQLGTGVDYPLVATSTVKPKAKYNLVFAGRLIERKGIMTLVEAFYEIVNKNTDVHLWILGDGELRPVLEKKIKDLKLETKISLTGVVSNPYDYFIMADICVFPSYQGEGLMGTVLEAMSAGKAVITTTHNGNEDVITNGENGILIRPKNMDDIVVSVQKLLNDTVKRSILGKNAQKHIEEKMTWDIHSKKLVEILKETISCTRG